MTTNPLTPPPEPRSIRLATCALGGAVAGFVLGVWGVVLQLGVGYWHSGMALPLALFIDQQFTFKRDEYLDPARVLGSAASGVIAGLLSSLFSRRLRHPIALASLWASILGVLGLVFVLMELWDGTRVRQHPGEALFMLAYLLFTGTVYGFTLGLAARLLERGWQRLRGPKQRGLDKIGDERQ